MNHQSKIAGWSVLAVLLLFLTLLPERWPAEFRSSIRNYVADLVSSWRSCDATARMLEVRREAWREEARRLGETRARLALLKQQSGANSGELCQLEARFKELEAMHRDEQAWLAKAQIDIELNQASELQTQLAGLHADAGLRRADLALDVLAKRYELEYLGQAE